MKLTAKTYDEVVELIRAKNALGHFLFYTQIPLIFEVWATPDQYVMIAFIQHVLLDEGTGKIALIIGDGGVFQPGCMWVERNGLGAKVTLWRVGSDKSEQFELTVSLGILDWPNRPPRFDPPPQREFRELQAKVDGSDPTYFDGVIEQIKSSGKFVDYANLKAEPMTPAELEEALGDPPLFFCDADGCAQRGMKTMRQSTCTQCDTPLKRCGP